MFCNFQLANDLIAYLVSRVIVNGTYRGVREVANGLSTRRVASEACGTRVEFIDKFARWPDDAMVLELMYPNC